ncbi:MAG: polymer-forming cytoskeletal protein [Pseudomonadota bacterium]
MFIVRRKIKIWGTIQAPEPVKVEGYVDGCVMADIIEVAFEGTVQGDVIGAEVKVQGTVIGDVYADKLILGRGCHLEGEIYHAELTLETGATFEGKSRRYAEPRKLAPVYEFETPAPETNGSDPSEPSTQPR